MPTFYPLLVVFLLSLGLCGKGLHRRFSFWFITSSHFPSPSPVSIFFKSSSGKAGSLKLKLNQTHLCKEAMVRTPEAGLYLCLGLQGRMG